MQQSVVGEEGEEEQQQTQEISVRQRTCPYTTCMVRGVKISVSVLSTSVSYYGGGEDVSPFFPGIHHERQERHTSEAPMMNEFEG